MNPQFNVSEYIDTAYIKLINNSKNFPPNSDIWDLRFHWPRVKEKIKTSLITGQYYFRPLQSIKKSNGSTCALWYSQDALVINILTLYLTPLLPIHQKCEHIAGHQGGKQSIQKVDTLIKQTKKSFICRTDIKGYYASINKISLLQQLRSYISDPIILDLLSQFLHYTVESGGNFYTPKRGIARSSSLSPLLGAFHLYCIDEYFAKQPNLYYARYMDDFIILTKTRWHLKRAVSKLNQFLDQFQFEQHPDKTFIGRVSKGFDWMGFWFTDRGCVSIAPRALSNHTKKLRWLYEQVRKLPVEKQVIRIERYLVRWECWQNSIIGSLRPTTHKLFRQVPSPAKSR